MKNKIFGIVVASLAIVALVAVAAGGAYYYYASKDGKQASSPSDAEGSPTIATTTFALAEVARHAAKEDCWLAIEGKVYDVTEFIESAKHPGGAAILEGCGKDATELFNTRPMGSKTPHSEKARGFLPQFYIGELAQ